MKNQRMSRRQRTKVMLFQKALGVFLLFLSYLSVKLLEGDASVCLLTVPLGIGLIVSREIVISLY